MQVNKTSAALLTDITQGWGLFQACKKNNVKSLKELTECIEFRPALLDKVKQRFGRDWKDIGVKIFGDKPAAPSADDAEREAIIKRLIKLKVGFHPNTGLEKLKALLEKAISVTPASSADNNDPAAPSADDADEKE